MEIEDFVNKRFLRPLERKIRKITSEDIEKYYNVFQNKVLYGEYGKYIKMGLMFWFGSYFQLLYYIWTQTKLLPKEKIIEILRQIWEKSKWSILALYILLNPIALISFVLTSFFLIFIVVIAIIVFILHPIHAKIFQKILRVPKYDDEK
jgi:hypothetical protein